MCSKIPNDGIPTFSLQEGVHSNKQTNQSNFFVVSIDLAKMNGTKHEHLNLFEEDQNFGLAPREEGNPHAG